jgi:LacI family transcriptional regulator
MPPSKTTSAPPVRLADVAKKTGLSRSGVSRALHNDPSIPTATCQRVQMVAKKMGFVANRDVAHAFRLVRASESRVFGTLGLIDAWPASSHWRDLPRHYVSRIYAGASERARELGYRLDVFSLFEPGMSARRLQSILDARGIAGLIIPPLPDDVHTLPINWDKYSCLALTHSLQSPALSRVLPHQYQVATLALQNLAQAGYRRIGFMTWPELDVRVNHLFRAAYLSHQYMLPPDDRLPMLMLQGPADEVFLRWYEKNQPDAILGGEAGFIELLVRHGLTDFDQLGYASIGGAYLRPGDPLHQKVAFVDQNIPHVGRSGVDQLVAQLDRRERGIPNVATVLMIEGTWVPGVTVRSAKKEDRR